VRDDIASLPFKQTLCASRQCRRDLGAPRRCRADIGERLQCPAAAGTRAADAWACRHAGRLRRSLIGGAGARRNDRRDTDRCLEWAIRSTERSKRQGVVLARKAPDSRSSKSLRAPHAFEAVDAAAEAFPAPDVADGTRRDAVRVRGSRVRLISVGGNAAIEHTVADSWPDPGRAQPVRQPRDTAGHSTRRSAVFNRGSEAAPRGVFRGREERPWLPLDRRAPAAFARAS